MTLEQVRRRYRLSLIGIPIIMLSMLAVRYGVTLSPYLRLGTIFSVIVIGAVILSRGARYGDMLDAHRAAVAAAKKHSQTCAENGQPKKARTTLGGNAKQPIAIGKKDQRP